MFARFTSNLRSNKYILGATVMSGSALTLSTLNNLSFNSSSLNNTALNSTVKNASLNSPSKNIKITNPVWTEKEIMSQPQTISKVLKFGAAFSYGNYGDKVVLSNLSNNSSSLKNIKNLVITSDTSLNEATYAKQLMEYLNVKSFDSVKVINSQEISNLSSQSTDDTGVLAVYNNCDNHEILYHNGISPFKVINKDTFTSNVTELSLIAAWFSQLNDENNPNNNRQELIDALHKLHSYVGGVIFRSKSKCIEVANFINDKPQPQNIYILGQGFGECVAKEGILKIKQIHSNNINAKTDYVMNEIDENAAVIMIILDDENSENMIRNASEIEKETNGKMIYITDNKQLLETLTKNDTVIEIPNNGPLTALLAMIPIEMIAYYVHMNQ